MAEKTEDIVVANVPEGKTLKWTNDLIKRTSKENPSEKDLVALREAFDAVPSIAHQMGNMQAFIGKQIRERFAGRNAAVTESIRRYMDHLKSELGYETADFMEKLLIDDIALRWLRLQVMENDHKNSTNESHTLPKGMYYEKRLHLTHQRFLRSITALAKVRKLAAGTKAEGSKIYKNLVQAAEAERELIN